MEQKDDWHLTEGLGQEQGRGDPFAAAIRGTRMPMVITNPRLPDNPIVFVNKSFQDLTGYAREEIIGRNCRFLQGPDSDPASVQRVRDAIAQEQSLNVDLLNYRKDGSTFWNALYISPVRGDTGEVQFFFASQLDITDRIKAQKALAQQKALVEAEVDRRTKDLHDALEAKTLLLNEVDHRVKNNLAMIGSLLRLQARSLENPEFKATLGNMLDRVDALAAVHRSLYQSDNLGQFEISDFATTLVRDVIGASGRSNIAFEADVVPATVPANSAAPVGLILNELVTNAVKHAFSDGRAGKIVLSVQNDSRSTTITLADDGPGFDPSVVKQSSIGRSLVDRLCRQIDAKIVWDGQAPGTKVSFTILRCEK